jgi:predicted small metal-binding protein
MRLCLSMRKTMKKLLRCRELGMDCDFEACGENEDEVLIIAIDHARAIYGLKDISVKDRMQAKEGIQDAFCVPKGGYNPAEEVFVDSCLPFLGANKEFFVLSQKARGEHEEKEH